MSRTETENELWERQRRREGWNDFVTHVHAFAFVNFGLFFLWSRAGGYPWFLWPLLFWGSLLVAHAASLWLAPYSRHERAAMRRYVYDLPRASRSGRAGRAGREPDAGVDRDRAGAAR